MRDEEIRKPNYGGFGGYEERRVRSRADEVVARHYKDVAARLSELERSEPGFDLLIVGGPDEHVEGLIDAIPPDVVKKLAGRFTVDPGTMTPAIVLEHSRRVATAFEAEEQGVVVRRLIDTAGAGGAAVLGMDETIDAVNQRAIETLLVRAGLTEPGSTCPDCGWVQRVAEGPCAACGASLREVPDVLDAIADAVRASGGNVQHILVPTDLDQHEVGAFVRYRLEGSLLE
jgi:peptide subunit release factor 1 (eRF1)